MALIEGTAPLAELRHFAATVSEYIAAQAPDRVASLPRGYSIALNAGGERALAYEGVLLSPWYSDPEPDETVLGQLAGDLKRGLVVEIERHIGVEFK